MIDTNECRSSRGVQFSPSPAFRVIDLNARRTWDAVQGRAGLAGEDEAVIVPQRSCGQPLLRLPCAVLAKRVGGLAGEFQRPAGLLGLGVGVVTNSATLRRILSRA